MGGNNEVVQLSRFDKSLPSLQERFLLNGGIETEVGFFGPIHLPILNDVSGCVNMKRIFHEAAFRAALSVDAAECGNPPRLDEVLLRQTTNFETNCIYLRRKDPVCLKMRRARVRSMTLPKR